MKKRIFAFIAAVLMLAVSFSFFCFAAKKPETRLVARLADKAGLIDDATEKQLLATLDSLSEQMQFDFVVATVDSTGGKDIVAFSDDYFDYNGFGFGNDDSGVALIISMSPREVYISGCGEGTEYFDYDDCQDIIDVFYDDLKAGNYSAVVSTFIDEAQRYVDFGRNGVPFSYRFKLFLANWKMTVLAPIIIGIALAILTVSALTKNLKSVKQKQSAADYEVPGSLRLTRNEDYFMYRNVSKTAKPQESSSGSSGTHTSSSGNSHSGGGRSF